MLEKEINLYIHIILDDGRIVLAGRLLSRNLRLELRTGYQGFFQYDEQFLSSPERYALDPFILPLNNDIFKAMRPERGIHGVFEDSLPGSWGERFLAQKANIHTGHYAPAHLLRALGAGGLGAIIYSEKSSFLRVTPDRSLDFEYMRDVLNEAEQFEKSLQPLDLKFLITGGHSAGGARPKVLVKFQNDNFLAKFSSIQDPNKSLICRLEQAGLALGRQIGLQVPDFIFKKVRNRPVLLVKRFDVTAGGGRRALVSFRTLLNWFTDPESISYGDMAEVIRRISAAPAQDLELLFKQMIFNILIVNTDDHLQNFSMVHDSKGWRLSPAYDLVPNLWREDQVLMVGGRHGNLTAQNVLDEGTRFGFTRKRAGRIITEVIERFSGWEKIIDHKKITNLISKRIKNLQLQTT